MGRTSKFSFPLPSRKYAAAKGGEESVSRPPLGRSSALSKAQRILGTDNDLNIDSPLQDDGWGYPSSMSSGMSISVSESTQSARSTNETGSLSRSYSGQWEHESGVLQSVPRLRGKASSTLLGQYHGEDAATDTSSINRRIRREGSDTTLKSYYDRQKSPLSVSQQTSASSARDMALRKGVPPVIPLSPLLLVPSIDRFGQPLEEDQQQRAVSRDSSRRKPARLDLSMLIPSSLRARAGADAESSTRSLYSPSSNTSRPSSSKYSTSSRRKLKKAPSKESLQSQNQCLHSNHAYDPRQRQTNDTLSQLYERYEQLAIQPPHTSQIPRSIPESFMPQREIQPQNRGISKASRAEPNDRILGPQDHSKNKASHLSPSDNQVFSWKNVRSSMMVSPHEVSSAASVSSLNTRSSRKTSTSAISSSDLKKNSVLSLSSDSEGETSDREPRKTATSVNKKASQVMIGGTSTSTKSYRHVRQRSHETSSTTHTSKKGSARTRPILTIPELSATTLLSHPTKDHNMEKSPSLRTKKPSLVLNGPLQHPTPPLSPSSIESREKGSSNRYMAVTKQEEALLEALRQKRARMREKIIEEHETAKSPPRAPHTTTRSSGKAGSNDRILLYLDTPISNLSPDLSSFLSSDEESPPGSKNWIPAQKSHPRIDKRTSSTTQNAALRAVRFEDPKSPDAFARVRVVDNIQFANQQDFLLEEENENQLVWGR
jgi:hypothetical protein